MVTGVVPRPIPSTITRAPGGSVTTTMPPGDYLVVAIDEQTAEGWQDAARLATLRTQASRITLRNGESHTLELRLYGRR